MMYIEVQQIFEKCGINNSIGILRQAEKVYNNK